jgi:hypothetical protein
VASEKEFFNRIGREEPVGRDQPFIGRKQRSVIMAQCPRSTEETELLIVGAGPFGLSLAAYAAQQGIDYKCGRGGRPVAAVLVVA